MISFILGLILMAQGVVMQQSLDAWSDPLDYREALYVHAPDGACGVALSDDGHTIIISLCEI